MFMICDAVNSATPNPNINIPQLSGPQVVLRPKFIPGNFSFGIAAGVIGVDLSTNNDVRFTISSPDGTIIQDSGSASFPALANEDTLPSEYQGFMLTLDVRNLVIEKEGIYKFRLWINGEEIGAHDIPIFSGKK